MSLRLEPEGLDRGFDLFTAVVSAGQLVGPALGGAVLSTAPGELATVTAQALLAAAALCAAALPVAAWTAVRHRVPRPRQGRPVRRRPCGRSSGCPACRRGCSPAWSSPQRWTC
ncbi:hypothetical protein [Geodermatophilus sp. DSM 45219]|uniref:hypothetical protein n=1 Tax=Geodermatophilus sp. DSM 45219 TaxID=1881103 RepID=UPI000B88CCF4|nr:hypothetical protein [Geodermatophilus sp. DSM 45219]